MHAHHTLITDSQIDREPDGLGVNEAIHPYPWRVLKETERLTKNSADERHSQFEITQRVLD
jgi:hypothetical protein